MFLLAALVRWKGNFVESFSQHREGRKAEGQKVKLLSSKIEPENYCFVGC